jgi:hypothetical protein
MNKITLVVLAALAASASSLAQTVPFQSTLRSTTGSGIGQSPLPTGSQFDPRVEAAIQYVGNLTLVEDGEPQIDQAGLELAPGFYASYSTGMFVGAIDYSLIGRAWEDSDFDDVSHRLSANGAWVAIPEWFRVSAQASYDDSVIDPRAGLNYGSLGIFGPGNLVETATASVAPELQHRFGWAEFTARYAYGRTWYLDEGKGQPAVGFVSNQDSTDQSAYVSLGTADTGSPLYATTFYEWEKSEFDTALPYEYERAGLDVGYQVTRTLTLLGDVGRESDLDESTTEGGLDSSFWSAGLRWQPNERTSAEGRYGERFFGSSWSLAATHQARQLEFSASYSEEPTVETRTLSLGDFDPGTLPPGLPDVNPGSINSAPFISRNANAGIRAAGSRTTLSLTAYQNERDYLRAARADETDTGVGLVATRQLASNLSADLELSWSEFERSFAVDPNDPVDGGTYDDVQAILRLNRGSGAHLTLSAEAGYLERSGDTEYDGWWTGLRARWTP